MKRIMSTGVLKIVRAVNLKILLLAGILITGATGYGHAQDNNKQAAPGRTAGNGSGISFIEGRWKEASRKATAEHKLIFADAYASWCGPCKLLKATTFKDKDVAAFFNSHFINLSVDVEEEPGPDLAARWKIQGLPALMVLDNKGKIIARSTGYLNAEALLAFAKQALDRNLSR